MGFLLPSLLIAAPYLRRDAGAPTNEVSADEFDRRIVTLLAFGPALMVVLMSLVTGRDAVPLWGYPLWLFLGLWIVQNARPIGRITLWRMVCLWAAIFAATGAAFAYEYGLSQYFRPHAVAVMFPGDRLGVEMSRRYRAMTGRPLAYVIGGMWEGGNIAHYSPDHPRVLIDGSPSRAPWIDLGDLRARGAIVVWPGSDARAIPPQYRAMADDAEIQQSFTLPLRQGAGTVDISWAVLRPRPVVAATPAP